MRPREAGVGLVELMLALVLGGLLVLGVTQVFLSARDTYLAQRASAMAQEDARFVMSKIAQEIRMVGMFGCLAIDSIVDAPFAFQTPISWQRDTDAKAWTFISASVGMQGVRPDWTVVSDCKSAARAYPGQRFSLAPDEMAFPVRRVIYWFENGQLKVGTNKAVLLDNVAVFDVSFGMASSASSSSVQRYEDAPADLASIRSVRIRLSLKDPKGRVKDQPYNLVVALRNRLG